MSVLFENAAGQLVSDPAGFLRLDWRAQPRTLADVQAFFGAAAHYLAAQDHGRLLANQAQMAPFTPEEQHWITSHWLPLAVAESGYRFGAVVVSANVLARLATSAITTSVQGLPLRYRSFDSEAEAVAWLVRQG